MEEQPEVKVVSKRYRGGGGGDVDGQLTTQGPSLSASTQSTSSSSPPPPSSSSSSSSSTSPTPLSQRAPSLSIRIRHEIDLTFQSDDSSTSPQSSSSLSSLSSSSTSSPLATSSSSSSSSSPASTSPLPLVISSTASTNGCLLKAKLPSNNNNNNNNNNSNNNHKDLLLSFLQQQQQQQHQPHFFMPCYPRIQDGIDQTTETMTTEGHVPVAEIFVIAGVLTLWFAAVVTFFKQWRSLRMLEPRESRFSHLPHNLGLVKVVKKHRDSVIYKNYPENWCRTIEARQRRLEKMRTKVRMTLCTEQQPDMVDADPYYCPGADIPMAPIRDLAASCSMIMASVQSEDLGGAVKSNFEQQQQLLQPNSPLLLTPTPPLHQLHENRSPPRSGSPTFLMETHL